MGELFSAFGVDWRLLIAQGVNFLIVFGGLTYFLYKPLLRMVTLREEKIRQGLNDAAEAETARAEIETQKTSILSDAQREAGQVVERAVSEAKVERSQIVKDAQARAEGVLEEASAQAEELKRRALAESDKEIAKVAILTAEKLLKEKLS